MRFFLACPVLGVLACISAAAAAEESLKVSVARDVAAITSGEDTAAEPNTILAIDPGNPGRMLGAVSVGIRSYSMSDNEFGSDSTTDAYLTLDGGLTWARTLRTHVREPRVRRGMDPAVAYGIQGTALVGEMIIRDGRFGFSIWRSADGGRTWSEPTEIHSPGGWDRIFMQVDRTPESRYHGRIYLTGVDVGRQGAVDSAKGEKGVFTGDKNDALVTYTSDDEGRSFQGPFTLVLPVNRFRPVSIRDGHEFDELGYPGQYALLADGTYLASWIECVKGERRFMIARSRDGGRRFDKPVLVGKTDVSDFDWANEAASHPSRPAAYPDRRSPEIFIPALAADVSKGPWRNSVYSVWLDYLDGQARLVLGVSRDGGVTWEPLRVISDERPLGKSSQEWGPHVSTPKLEVNRDGVVGLYYYAQKKTGEEWWPIFQASWDGGISWSAAKSVLPHSYDHTHGNLQPVFFRWKDSQRLQFESRARFNKHMCALGMSSDSEGRFSLMTIDTQGGDLYYRAVNVSAEGAVTAWRKVDERIELKFGQSEYDRDREEITVPVAIRNISDQILSSPLRLVLDRSQDAEGGEDYIYDAVNADNGRHHSSFVWNFGASSSALPPGAETDVRVLKFNRVRDQMIAITQGLEIHVYSRVP